MRGKSTAAPATTTAAAAKSPVVPTSATSATLPPIGAANASPALGVPSTQTTATFDQAAVDAEAKKRLAAEKARLDAEAAKRLQQQSPAQIAQATPARPTPQPVAPVPQPVAPTPQPVAPAPQPVAPAPQPVVPQPVPQPAEPQVARAREGELVPAGTEGLTPPRMTRQATPAYPPVARIQRIEGTVFMTVLISETGAVQDVKVIRGDPRLTEAAVQSVRRSGFSPGSKDGVRVKSWVPVSVSFKL
jgi:TonB family protein